MPKRKPSKQGGKGPHLTPLTATERMARFGSGLQLFPIQWYSSEFQPMGLSLVGFRALLKSLGVPILRVGSTELVELTTFLLAVRAITRQGEPDFTVGESQVDPDAFRSSMETVALELLYARDIGKSVRPTAEVRSEALALVNHLLTVSAHLRPRTAALRLTDTAYRSRASSAHRSRTPTPEPSHAPN